MAYLEQARDGGFSASAAALKAWFGAFSPIGSGLQTLT